MTVLLLLAGLFTTVLGLVHFVMPKLFDFENAIPRSGTSLKPLKIFFYKYNTTRSDIRGIASVMNHSVSFTWVTIGWLDLLSRHWRGTEAGVWIAGWISLWWFLRASCQFYLGHRRGDWFVFFWFMVLGVLHLTAAAHEF